MPGQSYGTARGGSYGAVAGSQYGSTQLGSRLELFEPGSIGPDISTDAVVSVSIGLEHSAVSDMEIELPPFSDVTLERFRSGEMAYYSDDVLLFRAEIEGLDVADDYALTLTGIAVEDIPLVQNEITRTFSDVKMSEAIRDVADGLPFDVQIKDSPPRPIDDEIVQAADVGAGFESLLSAGEDIDYHDKSTWRDLPSPYDAGNDIIHSLHETTPLKIVTEGLTLTPTCDFVEAEDYSGQSGTTTVTDNEASGFTGVEIVDVEDYIEVNFGFEHTIPAEHVDVSIRGRIPATGSAPYDRLELSIDNNTINTVFSGRRMGGHGTYFWADRIISGISKDLSAGDGPGDKNHSLRIEKVEGDDTVRIDCIAVYDDRFDFPNDPAGVTEVDENGALTEPALYPKRCAAVFDLAPAGAILTGSRMQAVMDFEGETSWGTIGFTVPATDTSYTGGDPVNVEGTEWTLVLDEPIDESAQTSRVHGHVDPAGTTLTGSDEPTTTPKDRTSKQTCINMQFSISGEEEAVIAGEREFQGTPLSVLGTMHDDSGRRYSVEHGVGPGRGPPVFKSYERDSLTVESGLNWVVTSVEEEEDVSDYANKITVIGAPLVPGSAARARATAKDAIEIASLRDLPDDDGIRPLTIEDDSLQTVNDCLSKARALLREHVNADNVGGSITTAPVLPTPGPQYLTEVFDDEPRGGWGMDWGESWGTSTVGRYSALESVTFSESAGSASTDMEFEQYSGLYRVLTSVRGE